MGAQGARSSGQAREPQGGSAACSEPGTGTPLHSQGHRPPPDRPGSLFRGLLVAELLMRPSPAEGGRGGRHFTEGQGGVPGLPLDFK